MSLRNRLVLPILLSTIAVLAGCGSSSSSTIVPPPTGGFTNANLNGTYVFSVSGTDQAGAPFAMVGTFTANGMGGNGNGGITGGTVDINDEDTTIFTTGPIPNASIGSGSYTVSVDGRGRVSLPTSTPFQTVTLDFVLQDSSHGLITEFDNDASGSGTFDLQSSGVSPVGTYAFSLSGADYSAANPFVAVGNFTLSGESAAGLEDFNEGGFSAPDQTLSGTVVLGPSSTPGTTLTTAQNGSLTYDVYAIDANHLKFIEMDEFATLSGDAYSQSSTSVPTGTLAFMLEGFFGGLTAPTAAGGFMVTNGSGGITTASTEDVNANLTVSPTLAFSAQYSAAGTGRYTLGNFSGFYGGTTFVAYPYSVGGSIGLFLLEMDNTPGDIMAGSIYPPQAAGATFNAGQGYGLNLTGDNPLATGTGSVEVDDIAEFSAVASGAAVTGFDDENFSPGGGPTYGIPLAGTYVTPDSNGRGSISATTSNSSGSLSTLNGGFVLTYYTVDGTTFPFIETDTNSSQVTAGVFVEQNATASASAAAAKPHMFVVPKLVKPHAAVQKKSKK